MIFTMIGSIVISILNFVVSGIGFFFPFLAPVSKLPWGVDALLVQGVGYFNWLMIAVPTLQIFYDVFIIYVSFRAGLMLLKLLRIIR